MASRHKFAETAVILEELRTFYDAQCVTYVGHHDTTQTGQRRKFTYDSARAVLEKVDEVIEAHDTLTHAVRKLG